MASCNQAIACTTSETRATCYACGEPVCTSPWCSRVRGWPDVRRRVCRDCDEHNGLYSDPEALERYDRRLMAKTGDTPSWR